MNKYKYIKMLKLKQKELENMCFYITTNNKGFNNIITIKPKAYNDNIYGDTVTKRVPLYPNVDNALMALNNIKNRTKFNVFLKMYGCSNREIYHPTQSQVYNINITNEMWSLYTCKLTFVGEITFCEYSNNNRFYVTNDEIVKINIPIWFWNID